MGGVTTIARLTPVERGGQVAWSTSRSALGDRLAFDPAPIAGRWEEGEPDDYERQAEYIERQYQALEAGKGWAAIPEMNTVEVIDAVSVVFPPQKEVIKELSANPSDEEALLFALGVEDKSFKLYYNSAQIAKDPEAKKLFLQLAGAEQVHFDVLMQRYESQFAYPR